MKTRAFTIVEIVVVLGLLGFGAAWGIPKFFNGDARRAKQAAATTAALVAAKDAQSAQAAASVTKMVEANATAPASWQQEFIALEGPVALSFLQKPDPMALARAEARRRAVAEGERDEARRLYALEAVRAADADKRTTQALVAKGKVDDELARVAAERVGAEQTRNIMIVVAMLVGAGWLWTKFTHLSPAAVVELRNDLAAVSPHALGALDAVTSRLQQTIAKSKRKAAEKKAAVAAVHAAP
jgi:hypothetical protein